MIKKRARGPIFWAAAMGVIAVGVLFAGSQFAHDRGQSVNWYAGFGQWLGAVGSFTATFAALYIATSDRTARERERQAADEAQARLVRIDSDLGLQTGQYSVRIRNYGDRAIIGVSVHSATLRTRPDAKWQPNPNDTIEVVQPQRESVDHSILGLAFVDAAGAPVPKLMAVIDRTGLYDGADPVPDVLVRFMDANGNYWTTGTFTDVQRSPN